MKSALDEQTNLFKSADSKAVRSEILLTQLTEDFQNIKFEYEKTVENLRLTNQARNELDTKLTSEISHSNDKNILIKRNDTYIKEQKHMIDNLENRNLDLRTTGSDMQMKLDAQ